MGHATVLSNLCMDKSQKQHGAGLSGVRADHYCSLHNLRNKGG